MRPSDLRARAAAHLTASPSLEAALQRLEFVQFDPIRSPARAQDLILRQRVAGYRAGDLADAWPALPFEEDELHVYGAMSRRLYALVHPRTHAWHSDRRYRPNALERRLLAAVAERGELHPRDAAEQHGRTTVVNGWGGLSAATTRALETLQFHGLVRVARRAGGVKVYTLAAPRADAALDPRERLRALLLHQVRAYGPLSAPTLRALLFPIRRASRLPDGWSALLDEAVATGAVGSATVEGERYYWSADAPSAVETDARAVRFLAPFDPVVWDRRRFAHLHGWEYGFEAYVPAPKRRYGYYALPMLYGDRAIGWVNARVAGGRLAVEPGFATARPREAAFRRAYEAEVVALATSLGAGVDASD